MLPLIRQAANLFEGARSLCKACLRLIISAALLTLLSACVGTLPAMPDRNHLGAAIDRLLDEYQPTDAPGLTVVVRCEGKTYYARSMGMANNSSKLELTSSTTFQTASLSKPFTAFGIMALVSQKKLRLTDSILNFIPELPAEWSGITIHHLLSQQSGIPDFLNIFASSVLDELSNGQLVSYYRTNPRLDFTPGARGAYSNANYVLLAEVIARVSGQSFGSFMQTNVFEPFGMSKTHIQDDSRTLDQTQALNFASNPRPNGIRYMTTGAINQISSLDDLEAFEIALESQTAVSDKTLELMATPHAKFSDGSIYGYGFFIHLPNNALTHGGILGGYRSMIYIDKKNKFSIATLGNGGGRTQSLQKEILTLVTSALGQGL